MSTLKKTEQRKHWQKQGYDNTSRKLSWEAFHEALKRQDNIWDGILVRLDSIERRLDRIETLITSKHKKCKLMKKKKGVE